MIESFLTPQAKPAGRSLVTLGLGIALVLMSSLAVAADVAWPDLAEIGHVSGRAATPADIGAGNAVFVIEVDGEAASEPVDVEIPQYAIHTDETTGEDIPVVLIQAENAQGSNMAGWLSVNDGTHGLSLLESLRLLGTTKP